MPTTTMRRLVDRLTLAADHHDNLPDATGGLLGSVVGHAGLLTAAEREPDPDHYRQHILHVDPRGRFSVLALVWLPGQATPIHDHIAWCATAVVTGQETEQRYELTEAALVPTALAVNEPGAVSLLRPPEPDIHRVSCTSGTRAISLHIYGADIARLGSSINTTYRQPIGEPTAGDCLKSGVSGPTRRAEFRRAGH